MIISPDTYFKALEQGATDEQLAPELAKRAGKDIVKLRETGLTDGQISRYFSGIDEVDFQNQQNPAPERSGLGNIGSQLARGVGDAATMWGNALKVADPEGGLNIGDKAGDTLINLANYAKSNLGIMKPDESEVAGTDNLLERGVSGAFRAMPLGISTMIPAILLAPFTGGSSLATGVAAFTAGASGAAVFGLGTYGQAVKDMQNAKPEATKEEIHNYALKQGFIEGGIEGVSNVLTFGILKMARISGISPANAIKQILKTPKKQLAKMWGLETLQETATETVQGALGAQVDLEAGMGTMSPATGAIESIIPAVGMALMFSLGGSTMNASRKSGLLKQLNHTDSVKRTEASEEIRKTLVKEGEPELAQTWTEMTADRIAKQQPIDVNQDIVKFDPNAVEQDKQDVAEAAAEPVQTGGVSTVTGAEAKELEAEEKETPDLGAIQEGDLLPYRKKGQPKNRPYVSEKQAIGAMNTRKMLEGKTFEPVEVKGGWVLREVSKIEPKTKSQKPENLDTEVIIKKSGFTTQEYEELTTEQQEQVKQEVQTKLVKEQLPNVAEKLSAGEAFAKDPTVDITEAKVTKVPYKPANAREKVMAPMDVAKGTREEKNLTKVQVRAWEQTQEAMLEDNDLVPWPVTQTAGKKGNKLSANFSWINEKAIEALPKEDRPKGGITVATLRALEKHGFIKRAKYTDGKLRWVPVDWKAPTEVASETRKAEPLVKINVYNKDLNKVSEVKVPINKAIDSVNTKLNDLETMLRCME